MNVGKLDNFALVTASAANEMRQKRRRNWSDSRRGYAWGKALEMKEIGCISDRSLDLGLLLKQRKNSYRYVFALNGLVLKTVSCDRALSCAIYLRGHGGNFRYRVGRRADRVNSEAIYSQALEWNIPLPMWAQRSDFIMEVITNHAGIPVVYQQIEYRDDGNPSMVCNHLHNKIQSLSPHGEGDVPFAGLPIDSLIVDPVCTATNMAAEVPSRTLEVYLHEKVL
ncbi:hypothetical protein RHSIM_Rhsim08G0172600 [Rhododendron simsii]|uniref:Uncharacterized protein n=1 Tax=Rhododendron simsii TaxID=118357 RepID=A0A834GMR5_RHOSS|nr:hypothetical protein RHSIM_Rhsim08G0172600 [Rhododendron simsii]